MLNIKVKHTFFCEAITRKIKRRMNNNIIITIHGKKT